MSLAQQSRRVPILAAIGAPRAHRGLVLELLVAAIIVGCASVLAVAELGSGDYGQWLMAARPYLGEQIPAYRLDAAVPPVVPAILASIASVVPDRVAALHIVALLLLVGMGLAAYVCAANLFRSRLSGVAAVAAALLLTDAFLELFAFGGLLQAGAILWLWLAIAAHAMALREPERQRWWIAGAVALGAAALSHIGTASIAVPAGVATAFLATLRAPGDARQRARRLMPLSLVLAIVAIFWLFVLLPGGTELARNPASLNYRGPDRLWESFTAFPPTICVVLLGLVGLAAGGTSEWRRRVIGPWSIVGTWMAVTGGVVLAAIVTSAATDYPRFATPILAPLVIASGAAIAHAIRATAVNLRLRLGNGTTRAWAGGLVTALVVVAVPLSVARFESQIAGYGLRDAGTIAAASAWIDAELPADATLLAPVREAKWIEGLTGRATLFSGAIRYSFRSEEWERSFAADTLLRSAGSIVNGHFFVRTSDADAATVAPRTLTIAANHGGEYLDLMRTVPSETAILGTSTIVPPIARLANLDADRSQDGSQPGAARVTLRWAGERDGNVVRFRQTVGLRSSASTLELIYGASTSLPSSGFVVSLAPAPGAQVTDVTTSDGEAVLTYGVMGATAPQLRFTTSGDARLVASLDGSITIRSDGSPARVLVTDLTASVSSEIALQVLRPTTLLDRYGVEAALLPRDSLYEARVARLEALGFRVVEELGPYSILRRDTSGPAHGP